MKISKLISVVISLPKTIYFNFRVLPFRDAIHLPIFVHYSVKLLELHKNIYLKCKNVKVFMIKIGLGGSSAISENKSYFLCQKKGTICFSGAASFGRGVSIRVDDGSLVFGRNFSANKNCFFSCSQKVQFGNDVLMGFNISVRDSDGHNVYYCQTKKKNVADVVIGDHTWIASHTHILKGTVIGNESIVAYGSIVWGKFECNHCLIGGYPGKILQNNISWNK